MEINELYSLYEEHFVPAYADLTIFTLKKYEEVMNGIHDAFFHVMQSFNDKTDPEVQNGNVKKAYDHILRSTLDCYKIMWVELKTKLDAVYLDPEKRTYCFCLPVDEVISQYDVFQERSKEARKIEIENVGVSQLASLESWKGAISKGLELYEGIDWVKIESLERDRIKWRSKETLIGFLIGIASSTVAAIIWACLTHVT